MGQNKSEINFEISKILQSIYMKTSANSFLNHLTLLAPISQNGKTHSNNLAKIYKKILLSVVLAIRNWNLNDCPGSVDLHQLISSYDIKIKVYLPLKEYSNISYANLNSSRPDPGRREKINLNFYFHNSS